MKKLSGLPWTAAMYTVGVAFLFASVGSTVIAWFFFPGEGETSRPSMKAGQPAVAFTVPNQRSSFNDKQLQAFLDSELFLTEDESETEPEPEAPVIAAEDDAVRSNLNVKLVGTIYGGDPFSGIALVENASKNSINSFMVGDILTDGAKVAEVLRERIIVMNNNRREYIDVQKTKLVRKRQRKQAQPKPKSPGIKPLATQPPPSTFQEPGFERKGSEMTMSQDYREKMLTTDFTKVLQDAKASPNMVDGELRGFKLTRIRQDSIYEKAGLQNDDIVEEVNGVPLTDTAQAIKLLNSLRTAAEIEVRVRRGGAVITMILAIQ